jgi:hypothetical protein
MSEYIPKKSECLYCYRKFGDVREILQGADGTWVHSTRLYDITPYDIKCNPFEKYVATPREEE